MTNTLSHSPLLKVEHLGVRFAVKRNGFFGGKSYLKAVDDISFELARGKTLAIVGESGSGKTTAALAVGRLVEAFHGKVQLDGKDFLALSDDDLRVARGKIQFIFQDPYSSLNPRLRAKAVVREPLDSLTDKSEAEKQEIIDQLFAAVGLRKEQQELFPHQFSGGQRQRIGIARALATEPELIICDEAVSALDVAVQAQILNLLRRLQEERGLSYLFISHDLGVVQHMCDTIAVMYMGRIVEYADRKSLFNSPQHPYTKALLSAVPSVKKRGVSQAQAQMIDGDPPDPVNLPAGCRFASRCPLAAEVCRQKEPELGVLSDAHQVACHMVE
ncbi:MAG: ABC transporter ATP-binding protein [Rhizobiaceae bacterium]|nr:ABC transporter ATP-binding protein [Rhizobiaceae bacterium]